MKVWTEAFVRSMESLARDKGTRPWHIFRDFCEIAYCTIAAQSQHPDRAARYEKRYMKLVERYQGGSLDTFTKMLGFVGFALGEGERKDFLGTIHEDSGFSQGKWGGQFWTPTHVAEAMARMSMMDGDRDKELITVSDPCCGSGRLMLAACKVLEEDGVEVADRLWTDSTDLDAVCAHITYIQLSLAGIPGIVRHGDSIALKTNDWAITPAGVGLYGGSKVLRDFPDGSSEPEQEPSRQLPPPTTTTVQTDLFS